jgi:nitrogen fixation protein
VSRWVIDVESLKVQSGSDLVRATLPIGVVKPFNRLCSADLAPISAFYNAGSGKGYAGQLFLNGEEDKAGGRAFAHAMNGMSYELADFGHIAWENLLANPASGDNTLVIGLDDIQNGLLLVYQGQKSKQGSVIQQAGLAGGQLYAVQVNGDRFSLVALPNMANLDGKTLRVEAQKLGASGFARPEDGAWDTLNSRAFWFNTTDKIGGDSRLSQLVFDDINNPQAGGAITTKIRASEIGAEMFDNLTVDAGGRVLLEEDPGEHERLSAIWLFEPKTNKTTKLFEANAELFKPGSSAFMTTDEEHSGIIEVTDLLVKASWFDSKRRYYLGTTQAHKPHADSSLVEYGQLWMISGPAN